MKLITGGAFQGKLAYAQETFSLSVCETADGAVCAFSEVFRKKCICNYHILVKRLMEQEMDAVGFTQRLCRKNADAVILINEIGCGIIPIEKAEREWREAVGRCGCILAANADTVIRLINAIPVLLKGEL